jgi:hypothetical protein
MSGRGDSGEEILEFGIVDDMLYVIYRTREPFRGWTSEPLSYESPPLAALLVIILGQEMSTIKDMENLGGDLEAMSQKMWKGKGLEDGVKKIEARPYYTHSIIWLLTILS